MLRRRVPAWLKTDKAIVALIGVLAASILPITTLIQARAQLAVEIARGDTELKLQAEKQRHDIRMAYFEKSLADDSKESRMAMLNYLAHSHDDVTLQKWAREEIAAAVGNKRDVCRIRRERCQQSCREAALTDWERSDCFMGCGFDDGVCKELRSATRLAFMKEDYDAMKRKAEEAALMSFGPDYEPPPDPGSTPVSSAPRSSPP